MATEDVNKWRTEAMYRGQRIEHLEARLAAVEALAFRTAGYGTPAWIADLRTAVRAEPSETTRD